MFEKSTPWLVLVFLCQIVVASTAYAKDPVKLNVNISIDPKVVEIGQTFQYTINAATKGNQNIRMVKEPDLSPFSLLGRSQMPQFVITNGVASHRTTLVYQLRTRRIGTFNITPPVLAVGKHRVVGQKLTLKVVARGKAPKTKSIKTQNSSAFIEASISKQDPYVGQQVTLDYDLYTDPRRIDVKLQPPTEPSLNAFWIEDLSAQVSGNKQVIRQRARYLEKLSLRRYALFPLKAGKVEIESMKMDLLVGGFFQKQQTVPIKSEPLNITIKPLPPNAPEGFDTGNVGQWNFLVTSDNLRARVGQTVLLRVSASGVGQASRIKLPEFKATERFRILNKEETLDKKTRKTTIRGKKAATYSIMPLKEGKLQLPALSFVYFDPVDGKYKTKQSAPIQINILEGTLPPPPEKKAVSTERKRSTGKNMLSSLRSELREPFRQISPKRQTHQDFARSWLYKILVLLPLLGLLLLGIAPKWTKHIKKDTPQRRRKLALHQAMEHLAVASNASDVQTGYDEIVKAIKVYLTQAMDVPTGAVTGQELPKKLKIMNVPQPDIDALSQILTTCNDARYASNKGDSQTLKNLIEQTTKTLKSMQKQLVQGTIAPWVSTIIVMLGFLLPLTMPGNSWAQDTQAQVQAAIKAQDAQKWDNAIKQWQTLSKAYPKDAEILYNLGTAALHKGDLGTARLSLERALLYKPNAPRIAKNLEIASRMVHLKTLEQVRGQAQRLGASEPFLSWNIARRLTQNLLSLSLLISVWILFLISLAYPRLSEDSPLEILKVIWIFALVVAIVSAGTWSWRTYIMHTTSPAIIMTENAPLKEGPSELAAPRKGQQPLVPGTKIGVAERRQSWVKVQLPDQSTGWLQSDSIAIIQ